MAIETMGKVGAKGRMSVMKDIEKIAGIVSRKWKKGLSSVDAVRRERR